MTDLKILHFLTNCVNGMHDPAKWERFRDKYFLELKEKKMLCEDLLSIEKNKITLLFGALDETHNQAAALNDFLEDNFL